MRATTSTKTTRTTGLGLGFVLLICGTVYAQPYAARFTDGPLAHGNNEDGPVGAAAHSNNDGPINPYGGYVPFGFPPPSPIVSPPGDNLGTVDLPFVWGDLHFAEIDTLPTATSLFGEPLPLDGLPIAWPDAGVWGYGDVIWLDDGDVSPGFSVPLDSGPTPVPEPATFVLLSIGLLAARRQRRR